MAYWRNIEMDKGINIEEALKGSRSWKKRMQNFGRNWSITEIVN